MALPLAKAKVGTATRSAIKMESGVAVEVELGQPGPLLLFSVAAQTGEENTTAPADARFVVEAEEDGSWKPIFDETTKPPLEWKDYRLDLASSAPSARRLRLVATAAGEKTTLPTQLYWSSAVVTELQSGGNPFTSGSGIGKRPNVVLISLDTVGAGHLSGLGAAPDVSPFLASIFAKSFVFTRAYAQYPNTLTSHASMFTGLLPRHHGVYGNQPQVRDLTLASALWQAGYVTNAVTEDGYIAAGFGFDIGFDGYDDGDSMTVEQIVGNASRTFQRAGEWLDTNGDDFRFFLFVHSYQAHTPYDIHDAEAGRVVESLDPDYNGVFQERYDASLFEPEFNDGKEVLPPDDAKHLRALYEGEINYLDRQIAAFFRHLANTPFADNTLVIITADHGDEFGEHGKLGHGETLYEEALHVPLAIYWPGVLAPGKSDIPVSLIDIMPTILDAVGLEPPPNIDGRSLIPIVLGERDRGPSPPVYSEVRYVPFADQLANEGRCLAKGLTEHCEINLRAVHTGRFKLIASDQVGFEAFFDLATDPDERTDARAQYPEFFARTRALLKDYDANSTSRVRPYAPSPGQTMDKETRERLRALGYVQ